MAMTVLSMGHVSAAFFVHCMLAVLIPGFSQDLATPVKKVTEMLNDMKTKSENLQKEANEQYTQVEKTCTTTKLTKEDEIQDLADQIEQIEAEVLMLETDSKDQATQMVEDENTYHQASLQLDELRKNRAVQQQAYQKDLTEYTTAITAVNRAISIMEKHASGGLNLLFLQSSERKKRRIQSALNDVAAIVRQLSHYTPDSGGLAKDEKIFDDFNTLTTNSGAYSSVSGTDKGVIGVLTGLQTTFEQSKTQLMETEKSNAETFTASEKNFQEQISTAKEGIATKKETIAMEEGMLVKIRKEKDEALLNKESTTKFLEKLVSTCDEKKTAHEEMSQLRTSEIAALTKAIEVISGTVAKNSESLDAKALMQVNVTEPKQKSQREFVLALKEFIAKEAGSLHSPSLMQLVGKVRALSGESPADAIGKVKTMISDLIVKLQQDSAADATQKAWCDAELEKNEKEKKDATASIEERTAQVKKLESDSTMITKEIQTLNVSVITGEEEQAAMVLEGESELRDFETTKNDTKESIEAVEAAITVLTEYYQDAAKTLAFAQQAPTPNNTMPSELTAADTEGPLQGEGANVIAMLEVVRDNYKTLLAKLESDHEKASSSNQQIITETKVMLASAVSDRDNKIQILEGYRAQLPQTQSDLNASVQSLADAEKNYENLKAPCLNEGAAEQRKQQLESEIAALNEALTMLDDYQGAASASLLQQWKAQKPSRVALNEQGIAADPEAVQRIAELLNGIKADVETDLAADTAAYNEMKSWCTVTITDTEAAIKVQNERDVQLVTAIEVSTQQKAVLTTQLAGLNSDLAKSTESLNQMGQLRENDKTAFQTSEKELIVAITQLRNAIDVLKTRYAEHAKQDERDFGAEQEQIEAEKAPEKTLQLTHIADGVAKALKALPANQINLAITGETGAILQDFLARPEQVLMSFSKKAGLTQTGSQVSSESPSGESILGILEQLMDTFTADLQAIRDRESQGLDSYASTKAAKQTQITAMEASISSKEGQLAHYTTMHAQAKEDLAYLRETTKQDVAYLAQVREQCRTSENNYQTRLSTRTQELAAISEAISILTASPTPAPSPTPPVKTLLHTAKHMKRVFVSHRPPAKRQILKVASTATSSSSQPQPKGMDKKKKLKAKSFVELDSAVMSSSVDRPLKQSLAVLAAQVKVARRQFATGPLTSDAIKLVVTKIDGVVADLQTQKQLEIKKKDTCVTEKNDASQQRERRTTDEARLENTVQQLTTTITGNTDTIAEIEKQVEELNNATEDAKTARNQAHAEYKASVQKEVEHQELLHEAIAALKKFYEENRKATLLQVNKDFPSKLAVDQRKNRSDSPGLTTVVNSISFGHSANGTKVAVPVSLHSAKAMRSNETRQHKSQRHFSSNQTEGQKQLDSDIEKNMDTKWDSVEGIGANRTEGPKGFSKPLTTHEGSIGIIGILEILVQDSESMIEDDVKAEQNDVSMHLANLEKTKRLIESKEDESASLLKAKNDAMLKKTQAEENLESVKTEISEIDAFILIVDKQCTTFLENFVSNQAARASEIDDVKQAKEVLLGMMQDDSGGGALAFIELARLSDRLQRQLH